MIDDDTQDGSGGSAAVVPFPYSRVGPARSAAADSAVCYGALATVLGIPHEQTTGHWCSRCSMIWYGYLLEVACPVCGNRHG